VTRVMRLVVAFFILCLLSVPLPLLAAERVYTLSYSPGTLFHQLVRERTEAVYKKAGLKAKFIPLPHNRSLMSANAGLVDGDVGRVSSIEEKYSKLKRVGEKLMNLNGVVYTLNPDIQRYDDRLLDQYRVGYVLGVRWPQKKMAGKTATTAPNYAALFEMLLQGRVDLILATEASADAAMHDLEGRADKVRGLQPYVFSAPIYHYVNEKNINIVPQLERALKELNKSQVLVIYSGLQSPIFNVLHAQIKEACRRINRVCEVRSTGSSQRALVLANEKGDGDAFRVSEIKEIAPEVTENLVQVPESIISVEFSVYSSEADFSVDGVDSLTGYRNGVRSGVKFLEKRIPGEKTLLPDSKRLLMMLQDKRLDTVSEHTDIADFIIQKRNLVGIIKLQPPLAEFPGYVYLHKKHKELVPMLAASIASMKADGSINRIKTETVRQLLAD
jgi:polar amino acid transport system substrate-binding protein